MIDKDHPIIWSTIADALGKLTDISKGDLNKKSGRHFLSIAIGINKKLLEIQ